MTPQYIQRSRKKGATHPKGTLFCNRPLALGNPFNAKVYGADMAILLYRASLENKRERQPAEFVAMMKAVCVAEYVSCFCAAGSPCHVQDVLMPMADEWAKSQTTA